MFISILHNTDVSFGKCIEKEISCGSHSTFYNTSACSSQFSNGQKLSLSKYKGISTGGLCWSKSSSQCTELDDRITLTCSKMSSDTVETTLVEEEETMLEQLVAVSAAALVFAALAPPALPMFPPQGLPQPVGLQGDIAQVTGGGILPAAALTVSY